MVLNSYCSGKWLLYVKTSFLGYVIRERQKINKKLKGVDCPKYKANDIPNGIYIVLFGLWQCRVTEYLVHIINFTVSRDE